jgi:hypothetical protein
LRQWGIDRKRRLGVLVRRLEVEEGVAAIDQMLGQAAAQGLAGVAVTGSPEVLESYRNAARAADAHGLFLVTCGAPQAA